jgi:hypothetical protein
MAPLFLCRLDLGTRKRAHRPFLKLTKLSFQFQSPTSMFATVPVGEINYNGYNLRFDFTQDKAYRS